MHCRGDHPCPPVRTLVSGGPGGGISPGSPGSALDRRPQPRGQLAMGGGGEEENPRLGSGGLVSQGRRGREGRRRLFTSPTPVCSLTISISVLKYEGASREGGTGNRAAGTDDTVPRRAATGRDGERWMGMDGRRCAAMDGDARGMDELRRGMDGCPARPAPRPSLARRDPGRGQRPRVAALAARTAARQGPRLAARPRPYQRRAGESASRGARADLSRSVPCHDLSRSVPCHDLSRAGRAGQAAQHVRPAPLSRVRERGRG